MSVETWSTVLFWMLAVAACLSSIAVVATQNIVRMAFWLLLALGAVGGLFFLLGADFVGAVQLLVYVGGTLVLLIFGVMLTARGPFVSMHTSAGEWVLAAVVGSSLLAVVLSSVAATDWQWAAGREAGGAAPAAAAEQPMAPTSTSIGLALLGVRPEQALEEGERAEIGGGAWTGYLLPFELASVHLLVVLIGAAYLARAKRRARRTAGPRPGPRAEQPTEPEAEPAGSPR